MSSEKPIPQLYFTDKPFAEALDPRVLHVWNLEQYEQRTPEWYQARNRCISASSISSALMQTQDACEEYIQQFNLHESYIANPKKSCSYKDNQLHLIMSKCGLGDGFKGNEFTLWGQKYEPIVSNIYSQLNQVDMLEFGLIFHPTVPFLGASPDGISTKGIMLEIKCPPIRPVKPYPPLYYFQQILMQLECCGLDECDYMDCHFIEYIDRDGWYTEAKEWQAQNPDSKHHLYGIIVSYFEGEDEDGKEIIHHVYAPPTIVDVDDFCIWSETEKARLEAEDKDVTLTLYKLHEYYISRVRASKDWFTKNLPVMTEIWGKIELGRTPDGYAALLKIKTDKEQKTITRRQEKKDKKDKEKKEKIDAKNREKAGLPDLTSMFIDLDITSVLPPVENKKSYYKHIDCLLD